MYKDCNDNKFYALDFIKSLYNKKATKYLLFFYLSANLAKNFSR